MYFLPILSLIGLILAFALPFAKGDPHAALAFALAVAFAGMQVIFGLFLLFKRRRAGTEQKPRPWGPVLAGVGAVLCCVAVFPAFEARMQSGMNRQPCPTHLSQIGRAIFLYQIDHGDAYPPSLDVLAEKTELPAQVFICPSAVDRPARGATPREIAAQIAAGGHCSFLYFGKELTRQTATSETIIACDKPENHPLHGANVLFGDGHVEWVELRTFDHLLDEVRAGHNPPRRPSPPASGPGTGRAAQSQSTR